MRRRLDIRILILLITATVLMSGGVHVLHGRQVTRNASSLLRRADRLEDEGKLSEATQIRRRYLSLVPGDLNVLSRVAAATDRLADTQEAKLDALDVLEKALVRIPGDDRLRRMAAERALGLGSPDVARAHLTILLKSLPDNGEVELMLGRCDEAELRYAPAASWYEKAREHAPWLVAAHAGLARMLRDHLDNPKKADLIMGVGQGEGIVEASGRLPEAYLERASYRSRYGLSGSEADLDEALRLAPEDTDVLLKAGEQAAASGHADQARELLSKVTAKRPGDSHTYQVLASLEVAGNRFKEALTWLSKGIEGCRDTLDLRWSRAEIFIQAGRTAEALAETEELRKAGCQAPLLAYLEGQLAHASGDWVKASRFLSRVPGPLKGRPDLSSVVARAEYLLGECSVGLHDPEQALTAFRRSLQALPAGSLDQLRPIVELRIASTLNQVGRSDEALEAFRKAAPGSVEARLGLATLLISRELIKPQADRRWDEASRAVDAAKEGPVGSPDSPEVARLRASILAGSGRVEEARLALEAARDRNPDRVEPWLDLVAIEVDPDRRGQILDEAGRRLGDLVDLRLSRAAVLAGKGGAGAIAGLTALGEGADRFAAPDRRRLLAGLASVHSRIGDTKGATELWATLAEQSSTDLESRLALLDRAIASNDSDGFTRWLAEVRRVEGEDGTIWRYQSARWMVVRAASDANSKVPAEARKLLGVVASRRPNWVVIPRLEAEADERDGNVDGALKHYLQAFQMGDHDPSVAARAATIQIDRGRATEAVRLLDRWRDAAGPLPKELQRVLSTARLALGDPDGAVEAARQAIRSSPANAADLLGLGRALEAAAVRSEARGQASEALSRREEAAVQFRQALAIDPARDEARVALIRNRRQAKRSNEVDAALAAVLGPGEGVDFLLAKARCLDAAGQPAPALEAYRAAIAKDPKVGRELALVLLRQGKTAEADAELARLASLGSVSASDAEWASRTRAALAAAAGRPREALRLLGEGVTQPGANDVEATRVQSLVLAMQPDRLKRLQAIRSLEDLDAQGVSTPEDRFRLAQLQESHDGWSRARELMQGLLTSGVEDPRYLAFFADALRRRKQFDLARVISRRLDRAAPGSSRAVAVAARLENDLGDGSKAAALVLDYARANPKGLGFAANLLEELKRFDDAEACLHKLADSPAGREGVEIRLALAGFLGRRGRISEAMPIFEAAWAIGPPETVAQASIIALTASEPSPESLRVTARRIEEALVKSPSKSSLRFALATVRSLQGDDPAAIEILRRLVQDSPTDSGVLNNLAWLIAYSKSGDPAEAIGIVNQALAIGGASADLLDTRGLALLASGKPTEAVTDLDEAMACSPKPEIALHLARARLASGNRKGAIQALASAEALGLNDASLHRLDREARRQLAADLNRH